MLTIQYADLIRMFEMCGFPPQANYLFLGDYVDRGKQSLETILLLLCYKIKFPENFFLLRGNHECANVTRGESPRRCVVYHCGMHADGPSVRLLRRVQATHKHQDVEDVHRRLQHLAHRFYRREQDLLRARRSQSESEEHG